MSVGTKLNYTYNLNQGVKLTILPMAFMTGDKEGHTFRISVVDRDGDVDLTGASVSGWFIPNDKGLVDDLSIPLVGTVNRNVASLSLPANAYLETGRFSLVIKLSHGEEISTIFWGVGNVRRSNTDSVVDVGDVIPSIEELLSLIYEMESVKQGTEAWVNATTETTTLEPGSEATLNIVKDLNGNNVLHFGIPQGIQGPKGVDGTVTFENLTDEQLESLRGPQGPQGETGPQGPTGEQGPRGERGATGATGKAATIKIGTVTTLSAGSNATVINSGTETDAVLNFGIPKGADGAGGTGGGTGTDGEDGGYYIPSVSSDGVLNWTATKSDMQPAASANIKGADGSGVYLFDPDTVHEGPAEELPDGTHVVGWFKPFAVTLHDGRKLMVGDFLVGLDGYLYRVYSINEDEDIFAPVQMFSIEGGAGVDGSDGGYYTPTVSSEGVLSWTASKSGMPSAASVNIKGPKGDTGLTGADGASVSVKSVSTSSADGGSNVVTFTDGKTLTVKNGSKGNTGDQGPQGEPGSAGKAATIRIGTVTTLPAGSEATVSNSGTNTDAVFDFGIPKGADGKSESGEGGADGEDGGYYIPFVADGTLSWTATKSDMPPVDPADIRGPQGIQGERGETGPQGETGPAGANGYSPVRGTDYWTAADIAEIKAYVDDAILGGAW